MTSEKLNSAVKIAEVLKSIDIRPLYNSLQFFNVYHCSDQNNSDWNFCLEKVFNNIFIQLEAAGIDLYSEDLPELSDYFIEKMFGDLDPRYSLHIEMAKKYLCGRMQECFWKWRILGDGEESFEELTEKLVVKANIKGIPREHLAKIINEHMYLLHQRIEQVSGLDDETKSYLEKEAASAYPIFERLYTVFSNPSDFLDFVFYQMDMTARNFCLMNYPEVNMIFFPQTVDFCWPFLKIEMHQKIFKKYEKFLERFFEPLVEEKGLAAQLSYTSSRDLFDLFLEKWKSKIGRDNLGIC